MPPTHDVLPPDVPPTPPSRRSILRGAAGAGAAGLALSALSVSPAVAANRIAHARPAPTVHGADDGAVGEAIVVHVRNVRTGELDVYRGHAHVRVHDRALAVRLAMVEL